MWNAEWDFFFWRKYFTCKMYTLMFWGRNECIEFHIIGNNVEIRKLWFFGRFMCCFPVHLKIICLCWNRNLICRLFLMNSLTIKMRYCWSLLSVWKSSFIILLSPSMLTQNYTGDTILLFVCNYSDQELFHPRPKCKIILFCLHGRRFTKFSFPTVAFYIIFKKINWKT